MTLISALLAAEPSLSLAQDTSAQRDFIAWAKSSATPIGMVEGNLKHDDLRPVTQIIGPAHVVALGEPAHRMHEPPAFRNRLFEFPVEHLLRRPQ